MCPHSNNNYIEPLSQYMLFFFSQRHRDGWGEYNKTNQRGSIRNNLIVDHSFSLMTDR